MTAYADASLLVAAFTTEEASGRAMAWLTSLATGEWQASRWVETESASGLAIKVRTGQLTPQDRLATAGALRTALRRNATMLRVSSEHFSAATGFLERSTLPLRGGDALHLAIAADGGATLWTLDPRMAAAGQALGLGTELLG